MFPGFYFPYGGDGRAMPWMIPVPVPMPMDPAHAHAHGQFPHGPMPPQYGYNPYTGFPLPNGPVPAPSVPTPAPPQLVAPAPVVALPGALPPSDPPATVATGSRPEPTLSRLDSIFASNVPTPVPTPTSSARAPQGAPAVSHFALPRAPSPLVEDVSPSLSGLFSSSSPSLNIRTHPTSKSMSTCRRFLP